MESASPETEEKGPEGPESRFARRLGFALLVLASFLPYHGCIARPADFEPPSPSGPVTTVSPSEPYVPIARVQLVVRTSLVGETELQEKDVFLGRESGSDDYGFIVFLALAPWLALWGLTRRRGSRLRRGIGILLWALSAALPPTVAASLILSRGPGTPRAAPWQAVTVAGLAALALAWRPPGRRSPEDVEATLSTHAVLGIGVALSRPLLDYSRWLFVDRHSPVAVAMTFFTNYRPGFWITLTALCLLAAPLYFSEESLRGLYDRARPWRSRSSTPTPTSTSTGSTPTGTPSSSAPAPPGSSPS